jgi:phosphoglucomutase
LPIILIKKGGINMYTDDYKRWQNAGIEDVDLRTELDRIEGNDEEIKDRFAVALAFGTAGLRGVLGAGTNRMNIYVVRQATQGLANWVKTQGGTQTVAISYDSRIKSDVFAKTAAGVLAANGINVRIYDAIMPVPALSFATRYYDCNAGIMVTASHNPAKYNGYKAYGPDGCQMTDDAAAIVYEEIQKTDVLTGAKYISFAEGVEKGLIKFCGDDCKNALYEAIESYQVRPGLCKTAGLKLVYSPLNGSGLVPVTTVLGHIGITDITIVPEQEYPNGYFTTCSYPNPEIYAALEKGLELAKETGADLMLATDPDADRVGIAMKCPDGSYELVTGNEVGVLLLDYICAGRIENGTMPERAVAVKSIVSTPLADAVAENYGVELRSVLTGFKWIGDQIAGLEAAGEVERFIFGFEESYGYLAGPYVRDKDAVIGSMLICEMAAYYRSIGSSLKERLEEIYAKYGRYLNKVDSFEFPGLTGMDKMSGIMQEIRNNPMTEIAGYKVVKFTDYRKPEETGLPSANVLIFALENGSTVVVRPSGTEPKIKIYYTTLGKDLAEAEEMKAVLAEAVKPLLE